VVHGQEQDDATLVLEAERVLALLVDEMPTKKAVTLAANITGVKKNWLYKRALAWRKDS
jgi:16S rRNA (cytidine1402-2'-O)-methyltransferase